MRTFTTCGKQVLPSPLRPQPRPSTSDEGSPDRQPAIYDANTSFQVLTEQYRICALSCNAPATPAFVNSSLHYCAASTEHAWKVELQHAFYSMNSSLKLKFPELDASACRSLRAFEVTNMTNPLKNVPDGDRLSNAAHDHRISVPVLMQWTPPNFHPHKPGKQSRDLPADAGESKPLVII